jgi:hypothetical protein
LALLNIYADLNRVALALEEIGHSLRELIRLHSPAPAPARPRKRIMPEDLVDCTDRQLVRRQEEDALRERLGLPQSARDRMGRLLYPEDYPEGKPDDAETRTQTVGDS